MAIASIGESFGLNTENTEEYTELINKNLATELGKNTSSILKTLYEDRNPVPYEEINEMIEKDNTFVVHAENDEEGCIIRVNVLDPKNERKFFIDLGIREDPKILNSAIEEKTYEKLLEDTIDPTEAIESIQTKYKYNQLA